MKGSTVTSTLAQLAGIVLVGSVIGVAVFGWPGPTVDRVRTFPPCAVEDSGPTDPCLWDGPTRGNGQGNRVMVKGDH